MEIIDWVKKQTGKIADNVKDYRFYVKHNPPVIDSSTTLVLTTFTNRDQVATVPCIYKWSRVRNGLVTEVPEFKGNSFICQPSDIGSIIQAEVTSTDVQHGGTAVLQYGPVKLDVLIKKQIQHALATGSAVINVDLIQKNEVRDCQVKIMEDNIRISHCNSQNQYTFDYTIGQPRIDAMMKEPTKAAIVFSEKHETQVGKFIRNMFGSEDMTASQRQRNQHRLELRFNSRNIRDNFLFIIKAFNTKRAMKNSVIMSKIEQLNYNDTANFNYIMEIDGLKMDLFKLNKLNEKYLNDKKMYYDEARRYQKQIQQTIVTYTKIVQNKWKTTNQLDESVMELRDKKDQAMERKIQNLLRQNDMLNEKVTYLTSELNNFYPQNRFNNEPKMIDPSEVPRGGFIKKKQVGQNFEQILSSLNQSEVKEPGQLSAQVKQLSEEKKFLAKKLNESVQKVAALESKVKKIEGEKQNLSAINLNYGINKSQISMDRGNVTSYNVGENINYEVHELKMTNSQLLEENKKLRSQIPMVSSKTEKYHTDDEKKSSSSKRAHDNPEELRSSRSKENQLHKIIDELTQENLRLKNQIEVLTLQKQAINKQKQSLESKYKRKVEELGNQVSMYRRNQDALNRSQHLSMEMDLYNQQQNDLLKEQNELLVSENEKLSKLCQKYMKEAKQIPKLREEIMAMKKTHERKKTQLSYSKSQDDLLLEWKD